MISFQLVRGSLHAAHFNIVKRARSVLLGVFAVAVSTIALAHDPVNNVVEHVQGMLQMVYENPGATAAQKTRLATLAQQASADLAPIQEQMRKSHAQIFALITAETIDRSAIETARAAQMNAAEQESMRATQFITDVAETLTPTQRKAIVEHMSHHEH